MNRHLSPECEKFIKTCTNIFLKKVDEMKAVIHTIPNNATLIDCFSQVLTTVYQSFMLEDLPAVELLIDKGLFVAASKISRSMLEIAAVTSSLFQMESSEREKQALSFMEFNGGILKNNGKTLFNWLEIVYPNKSIKDIIISQGLDKNDVIDFEFATNKGGQIKLSLYDFLSKVSHYNPKILKNLLGVDENGLAYRPNYVQVCLVNLHAIMNSFMQFCIVFYSHLYQDQYQNRMQDLFTLLKEFFSKINNCCSHYKP